MLNPVRVDAAVDLAYGALILLAIALIATVEFGIGIAFGLGVFSAYLVHVVWKMARFDPDWMTAVVEDAFDQTVTETVEEAVDETMADTVDETVEEAVADTVDETVTDTVADTVEEAVDETVGQQVAARLGDQLDTVQAQVEAVDNRLDDRPREDRVEELIQNSVSEEEDTPEETR